MKISLHPIIFSFATDIFQSKNHVISGVDCCSYYLDLLWFFFSSSFSFLSVNMQKKISPYYMKFKSLFFKGVTIISHLFIPHVFPFLTENSCLSLFLSPKCTPGPFIMWQLLYTYSNTWKVNQLQNKRVKQYTQRHPYFWYQL